MDDQDQSKLQTPEHEGHGVHVCHKCRWPFPKSHPSARQRRAHKKICGTIEGYKLVDSVDNPYLNISDDEHFSDEDHASPSPRVLEKSKNEKGSRGFGERSNRSEDDLFSDAVAEFSDSGVNAGNVDVEKVAKDDPKNIRSFKDVGVADIIQPPIISADSSQIENPGVAESTGNQLGSKLHLEDHLSNSTISSMESSISHYITEESVTLSHDRECPTDASNIIKPETLTDASSQDNEKVNAREDVTECSLPGVVQVTDAKGTEESNRNFKDFMVSPSRFAAESFEILSKLEETVRKSSDPLLADRVFQSEGDHHDGSSSKKSQNDPPPEVDFSDHGNASFDSSQIKVDTEQGVNHANSGSMVDSGNQKEERNDNPSVLSVPDVSGNHVNASIGTPQIMVDALEIQHVSSGHILESCNRNGEENTVVNFLAVTDDISIVRHPEVVVDHFKYSKGVKLPEYAILDSCATIPDKEDSAKDSTSEDNSSSFQSRQLSEGAEVPSSDIHVLGDSGEHEGGSIKVGIEVLAEEGADESQIMATINETGSPAEVVIPDIEENHMVQSHEEQETNDIHCNELMVNFPENASKYLSDAGSNQAINLVGVDDAGSHEKARNERLDIVGDDDGKGDEEENCNKMSSKNAESTGKIYESLVDPTNDLPEGDEAGDHEKGKMEKYDIDETASREGSKEDDLPIKPKLSSESASSLHESQAVADDVRDGSLKKLPEHEFMHLDAVSHSSRVGDNTVLDASITNEVNGSEQVEVESVAVSTANESCHDGDVNSLQKTSEDHMRQELNPSDLVTGSSVQICAAVKDNNVTESGITSESLEGDSNIVKQQIAASVIDASVDSYSQTDSLEGNWGSVSVLSTQSVMAALIDTETLPSSDSQALIEAEKVLLEKPEAAPERQPSDKSDMFEAPSFMTLVEPRDRSDQKATASEVQTRQNPPQQSASLQAGWFPSLTHVVNESQGRKKNEEIIAKVTNWSTGKQHTPLKSLLGEASLESKQKLKKAKENPAPAAQKDETFPKDNGASVKTVNSSLGPELHTTQAARTETKKEWTSPARYPSEIKREKRKVKGRPYWVQFVCCSSMN